MTPECALAKLSYLLAKGLEAAEISELMGRPLRGELTSSRGGSPIPPYHRIDPAAGPTKNTDVRTLLAHILQNHSKAQSSTAITSNNAEGTQEDKQNRQRCSRMGIFIARSHIGLARRFAIPSF